MTAESSADDEQKNALLVGRIDVAAVRLVARLAEQHGLLEIELRDGDRSIRIRRACGEAETALQQSAAGSVGNALQRARLEADAPQVLPPGKVPSDKLPTDKPPPAGVLIRAPMAGTFYRAPAPGQPVFVDVGSSLQMDTVVGIIESMKMMNRVEAEQIGQIATVLVSNGSQVQVGQPLFSLAP